MRIINKVSIYGSGLMSRGIALLFARKNFEVLIYTRDISTEKNTREKMICDLEIMKSFDILGPLTIDEILNNISFSGSFEEVALHGDLVIESIIENLTIKQEYFGRLDAICAPEVILASNTSAISITEIGANCVHKDRIIGTHFWNPAHLIPLVEIVRTEHVADNVVKNTYDLLTKAGKKPIIVKKDLPGFLANRIQNAINREAYALVNDGVADAKDVDDSIKYGFGMRLPFQGPMEKADMIGLDIPYSVQTYLFPHLSNATGPAQILKDKIDNNELGFKTGKGFYTWTDEEIAREKNEFMETLIKIGKVLDVF